MAGAGLGSLVGLFLSLLSEEREVSSVSDRGRDNQFEMGRQNAVQKGFGHGSECLR